MSPLVDAPPTSLKVAAERGELAALAMGALRQQLVALREADQPAYLRTWDSVMPAARRRATTIYANLAALHAVVTSSRYVLAGTGHLPPLEQRRLDGESWTAEVELSWRLREFDDRKARSRLTYTFVQRGGEAHVVDVVPATGERAPIWLAGDLVVHRGGRTLVAATTPRLAAEVDKLLRQAVVDVSSVVVDWRGGLVAYVPAGVTHMEALLGAAPGSFAQVAAVTTTVDGSRSRGAPVAVVINPAVFERLGHLGSQVVVTHESTHAATGAAAADLPLWLAEGFADYVGLGSVEVPISVSGQALIRDVRRHGIPEALPSNAAFRSGAGKLEVYYEQAWMAAHVIARSHGQGRLVALYERAVATPHHVRRALRATLHTTLPQLTASWRRHLRTVAGVA